MIGKHMTIDQIVSHRFFNLLFSVSLLSIFCGSALADPLDWDMFALPVGYGGEAVLIYNGRETQNISFDVTREWVRRDAYLIVGDLGESLIDARLSTYTESWMVDGRSSIATRSDRFATELTEAGEIDLSPIGALRPMIGRRLDAEIIPHPTPGSQAQTRLIRVDVDGIAVEFDLAGSDLAAYREIGQDGVPSIQVEYLEWQDLPSGKRYPRRMSTKRALPDGSGTFVTETFIQTVREITEHSQAPSFKVPEGFAVIDHISGVSRNSGGSIIGPLLAESIEDQPRPIQPTPSLRTEPVRYWRLIVGAGILVMVVGGFVAMRKRSR